MEAFLERKFNRTLEQMKTRISDRYNTRAQLYDYCKRHEIPNCSKLSKNQLVDVVTLHYFNKKIQKENKKLLKEFKFDDDIFTEPRRRRETILNKAKDLKQLPNLLEETNKEVKIIRSRGAFGNLVVDYSVYCESAENDFTQFLYKISRPVENKIIQSMQRKKAVSIRLVAVIQYVELDSVGNVKQLEKYYLRTIQHQILTPNVIDIALIHMKNELITKFESFNAKNSKLRFDKVIRVDIQSDKSNPLRGGTWIQLPSFIQSKKACINVKNIKTNKFKCQKLENLRCFEYALESMLRPATDVCRATQYDITRYEGLLTNYPVAITRENIEKYENLLNVSINVYTVVEEEKIYFDLAYKSYNLDQKEKHVNLLLYRDHVVGIKNLSALLKGQLFKRKVKMHICAKCHSNFPSMEKYEEHINSCIHNKTNIKMPKAGTIRKYKSNGAEQFHPYTVTLDFECTLKKTNTKITNKTSHIHEHIPNSFSFHTPDGVELINSENTDILMKEFNNLLVKYGERYDEIRKMNKKMNWNDEIKTKVNNATKCEMCEKKFDSPEEKRVDHNHMTGKFRAVLCNTCNLNLQLPRFVPVLIHNIRYDSMIFLSWILKLSEQNDIQIIPNSKENYITFSKKVVVNQYKQQYDLSRCTNCKKTHKNQIMSVCPECKRKMLIKRKGEMQDVTMEFKFIDTFKFISTSLEKAVKNLVEVNNCFCAKCNRKQEIVNPKLKPINENGILKLRANCKKCDSKVSKPIDYKKFKNILKEFRKEDLHLVLQKGVYPYEWMDNYAKMNEQLPLDLKDWYSTINDKTISERELRVAQRVYKHFNCQTFKDYHNLYLKLDTVLLKDVFDNFRTTCYKNYKLDPVYYISAPNLADAASLKETQQQLGLISNQNMYELYEKGVRGGISMIPTRKAVANNCYFYDKKSEKTVKLSKEKAEEKGIYNSKKALSYLLYLDCNNLYGHSLSQPLPVGDFSEEDPTAYTVEKILSFTDDRERGYTFVVDLEIPAELHDKFKDYPMLPEHYTPSLEELSDYQRELIKKKIGTTPANPKLINTLKPKKNYIIDYRMLKECIRQGIILKKVKRAISFEQKAWLKPYIEKNTKLRQEAKNDFEKDFYKLMNNSVYGKQMENVRSRCDVKLLDLYVKFEKHKEYENRTIVDENTVLLYRKKPEIKLNKPIYGGFVVLELSKILMYRFYYNQLKSKYGDRIKLCATDTDSLIVYIETEDVYEDIKNDIENFDTCGFTIDWMPQVNNKVPGLFKDEYLGMPIREFVGLRAKMYAFKTDIKEKKVCKGIRKCNIEKMKYDMYNETLLESKITTETVYNITSKDFQLYTVKSQKTALSPFDDKRYLVDNINTLPYGYLELG